MLCRCTTALAKLTGSLASLAHNLPHRRRWQQRQAASQHPTLDLEVTAAETIWFVKPDAAHWDIPVIIEIDAATDDVLPTLHDPGHAGGRCQCAVAGPLVCFCPAQAGGRPVGNVRVHVLLGTGDS